MKRQTNNDLNIRYVDLAKKHRLQHQNQHVLHVNTTICHIHQNYWVQSQV